MRRRNVLISGAVGVALVGAGWGAWHAIPYQPPAAERVQPASVTREIAYARQYWQHRNAAYGSYAGTDCVNFTSQVLHARGWPMTAAWGSSELLGRHAATRTWLSSTAMMHWLAHRPDLAVAVDDRHRDEVAVGDIAQFDWDGSGDRDHTAIVSRVLRHADGTVDIDVAEHSPSGMFDSVDARLAQYGPRAVVHYWHLTS